MASRLLIRWPRYTPNHLPVERLVLYRAVNNGPMSPYTVITNMQETAFLDRNVKFNRRYCYELRALTHEGLLSKPSMRACAKPLK